MAKDEHGRDYMKYVLMSHPEPTKTARGKAAEALAQLAEARDLTSANIRYQQIMGEAECHSGEVRIGRYRRR